MGSPENPVALRMAETLWGGGGGGVGGGGCKGKNCH